MKKIKVISKFSDGQVVWVLNSDNKIISAKVVGFIGVSPAPDFTYPQQSQVQLQIEVSAGKKDHTVYYANYNEVDVFTSKRAIVKHVLNEN